jgi:type IV pilus assembly protein PilO
MTFIEHLKALNEIDLADLNVEDIGAWPAAAKLILLALVFIAIVVAGFYLHIADLEKRFEVAGREEVALREEFERKAFESANLEAYKEQLREMEERFGALVAQLPSRNEVPGLLDDITEKGELNGLSIEQIDLLKEEAQPFYVELPIAIEAIGSYHDLGAFISGMAGLSRIVTLHDFEIVLEKEREPMLGMSILAKTYRYRGDDDEA